MIAHTLSFKPASSSLFSISSLPPSDRLVHLVDNSLAISLYPRPLFVHRSSPDIPGPPLSVSNLSALSFEPVGRGSFHQRWDLTCCSLSSPLSPPLPNCSAVKLKHLLTSLLSSDTRVAIWEEKRGWADERAGSGKSAAGTALRPALSSRTSCGPASEPVQLTVSSISALGRLGLHSGVSAFLEIGNLPKQKGVTYCNRLELPDCYHGTEL